MSVLLEVYYKAPEDPMREKKITEVAAKMGGKLDFKDLPDSEISQAICLAYEFLNRECAERAAECLRSMGEHVEGPCDYG